MSEQEQSREDLIEELTSLRKRIATMEEDSHACKTIEHALKDQLLFLQTLIDTIPNPIFYKDAKGFYLGCNKAFASRLGLKREEVIGKTSYDIFPREVACRYQELDSRLLARTGEEVFETSLVYADGERHDVLINKGTFTDSEGVLAGVVGVTVDITERKAAREALQKAHDELEARVARRTAELARAVEDLRVEVEERKRAEEAVRSETEKLKLFAYSVAHDLKSPAIGVYGLAKLLYENYSNILEEKGARYCDLVMKASEHIVNLVQEINVFIATKEMPLDVEDVSMDELFRTLEDEFSTRLTLRRIQWSQSCAIRGIRADRLSILRVFRNLIDNAFKYGGEKLSRIAIGCEETPSSYVFSVEDDGVGVKGEDAEKIFGLFQRYRTSKGVEGTGLGLAIVKEIAEKHGGRVWVRPGAERGIVFYVAISKSL